MMIEYSNNIYYIPDASGRVAETVSHSEGDNVVTRGSDWPENQSFVIHGDYWI